MTTLADALISNSNYVESDIGFEPVGRAVRLLMADQLNEEIDRVANKWHRADLELQDLGFDPGVGQVEIEHIPLSHIHEGPHRSFIEAPPEEFPNLSVMAYNSSADAEQFDQIDVLSMKLYLEPLCIAGPVPEDQEVAFETIVHRRIQRTTEAVVRVIKNNPTLLGTVRPIQLPPRGGIGQSTWARRKEKGQGPRYLWQGARLEYTLQRHSE